MGENLKLSYESKHILEVDSKCKDKAFKFCEGYKEFIKNNKTERECTKSILEIAKKNGYKEFNSNVKDFNSGDRFYVNNKEKSVVLFTIGKEDIKNGVNLLISHIDSPRLDLKPNPMIENDELLIFKTHYYGGIKKYQWPTVPLSMHGRIFREDGTYVDIKYGEKEEEPKFVISDLLPHLSIEQDERKLKDGIKGEELNILIGSIIVETEDEKIKSKIKENTLKILYETFNITEKDFIRAEIEFVPAFSPADIGFDRSMIAGYGQDDRVCAYPSLIAEIENVNPERTSITVFTDKEEIGSEGNTGLISNYLFDIIEDIADIKNVKARDIYRNSLCISSDVSSAYDPTFSDVFDKHNSSKINHGVIITKYTGHRGKSGANDASCETVAKVIKLLEDNNVIWQADEMGKVDIGGGGTIAKYVSQRNIDTIDSGVPVLSMHSPYEITSKLDIYHTYLAYKAFLLNK